MPCDFFLSIICVYPACEFPPPKKLWPYDYIVEHWKRVLVFKGVGDARAKAFLAEEGLLHGSEYADIESRWSQGHEFWEATIAATGQQAMFFSHDSITELQELLTHQCEQVTKGAIALGKLGHMLECRLD